MKLILNLFLVIYIFSCDYLFLKGFVDLYILFILYNLYNFFFKKEFINHGVLGIGDWAKSPIPIKKIYLFFNI